MTGTINGNKRILFLRSNPVDPDPRVEKEADTLLKAGYAVDILCWDRQEDYTVRESSLKLDHGQCKIFRAGIRASFGGGFKKNLKPLLQFQRIITSFMKENHSKYAVVHACDFDTAFAAYRATRGTNTKLVYDIFDYYADAFSVPGGLKKLVASLDARIINHADGVIICSEQRREQISGTHPQRLTVIHNAPPVKVFENGADAVDGYPLRIAYVGILSEGRLIPELLEIVSQNEQCYELHIAGFGILEPLVKGYAKRFRNIIFYGKTEYAQTLSIENKADVMTALYDPAVANHKYAAPNKFYEAMMLGKPLVTCKGTGMADLVREYGIGVCIEYSGKALADGLDQIRDYISEYRKRSGHEKELFKDNYSWEIMDERLRELYSKITGEIDDRN